MSHITNRVTLAYHVGGLGYPLDAARNTTHVKSASGKVYIMRHTHTHSTTGSPLPPNDTPRSLAPTGKLVAGLTTRSWAGLAMGAVVCR